MSENAEQVVEFKLSTFVIEQHQFQQLTLYIDTHQDINTITDQCISQLPKLCVKISILRHRRMWVRSFSTRLTSVTFAKDKVLIFLILRKNAKIVQL